MNEIDEAVKILDSGTQDICIMQCNTNYTGSLENIYYQNLNVLKTFQKKWPKFILGLSDHTAGHSSVLEPFPLAHELLKNILPMIIQEMDQIIVFQ